MPRWPTVGPVVPPLISPFYTFPGAVSSSANISSADAANFIVYFPIVLPETWVATKLWWQNGLTVSGNVDCGIYDQEGNRLISTGSTAQAGTSSIQEVNITDTIIPAGLIFMALVPDNGTSTFWMTAVGAAGGTYVPFGGYEQTATFPLPATATFAGTSGAGGLKIIKYGATKGPRTVI